jgi:NTP pyrophosphatase (non-canonical NTP hydrolase)
MIEQTFEVSGVVAPRTRYEVLASLVEEVGELATEVAVREGYSNKATVEGIMAEGVDVITCVLDLIWVNYEDTYTPQEIEDAIMNTLKIKLAKWRAKKEVV